MIAMKPIDRVLTPAVKLCRPDPAYTTVSPMMSLELQHGAGHDYKERNQFLV